MQSNGGRVELSSAWNSVVQEQGGSGTISRIFLCINGGTIVWVNDDILCPQNPTVPSSLNIIFGNNSSW